MAMSYLPYVLNLNATSLNEEEKKFISKIYLQDSTPQTPIIPNRRLRFTESSCSDFVENIMTNNIWTHIERMMGSEEFSIMWSTKLIFYEISENSYLALNSRLISFDTVYHERVVERKISIDFRKIILLGYNPSISIDRKSIMRRKISTGFRLIESNYQTICKLINDQDVGVVCDDVCSQIPVSLGKLLKKFATRKFKMKPFKRKLDNAIAAYPIDHSPLGCVHSRAICSFLDDVLTSFVPRNIIGSKINFVRVKKNICHCVMTNPLRPFKLGTVMKGLTVYTFPRNIFLAKFVLFLVQILGIRLLFRLLYVTETLQGKCLLFFQKRNWVTYEKRALNKMIVSGVLKMSNRNRWDQRTSKMMISYKHNGFRPIVFASAYHKITRNRLLVCNAFLKSVVAHLNPRYGKTLSELNAQWRKFNSINYKGLYFVRSDVSDAFLSIDHEKMTEILNRRLAALGPAQTCRTFEYVSNGRKRSALHFTTLTRRVARGKVYCEVGKKVYSTSYLKALILLYIKQNFVTLDGKMVFHHSKGVPQGCYLSAILCELYLCDMDDFYFVHLKGENDLFIRATDDYLFITRNAQKATQFLERIFSGIHEYGIEFKIPKTVTNLKEPMTCLSFFGFILYPMNGKIQPDFRQWDDVPSRISLHSRLTWETLVTRMKMICYVKLDRLILDSRYLHKFVVFENVFVCSKIHAAKYEAICTFLLENFDEQPTFEAMYQPIVIAANAIARKVIFVNKDINVLSYNEIKLLALKAFAIVLLKKEPFVNVVSNLNKTTKRLLTSKSVSLRSRKMIRSLIKSPSYRYSSDF